MNIFSENKNLYPTPDHLASRMIGKIEGYPKNILESQAGFGHLVEALQKHWEYKHHWPNIVAIEIDENLQAILRGKKIPLIDSDFLSFQGPDKFDLIFGNPPYDNGEQHLLKAIDILYRGQIIYLLNAETLKNPCTNARKDLVRQLEELNADVEYIDNAFLDAERKTRVEVALVNIVVERRVEDDLFAGADDHAQECQEEVKDTFSLTTGQRLQELVARYNEVVKVCTETLVSYYKNYNMVSGYIGLNQEAKRHCFSSGDLTTKLQDAVNQVVVDIRENYWRKTLDLSEVQSRLTEAKRGEFENQLAQRCHMDFTEKNIRSFILNIINGYEQTVMDSVLALFDKFTRHGFRGESPREKNIHYFNGWKTNDSFKVKEKIIIPIYGSYGGPFQDWGKWSLDYKAERTIQDIDLVMNYFDGKGGFRSICQALKEGFEGGENLNLESTYFKISAHKKGTLHLTFLDKDILRRFNVAACKGKGWLPEDYGTKNYVKMLPEERELVDSFEGAKIYEKNVDIPLFPAQNTLLKLAA